MKVFRGIAVVLIIVLFIGALPQGGEDIAHASPTSTQQEIDRAEDEKNNLENELDKNNKELDHLQQTESTLLGEINSLNAKLETVSNNLASLETQIDDKNKSIEETREALEIARETESWQYDCMVRRICEMYEKNEESILSVILGAGSFSEALTTADYYELIEIYDKRKMKEFKETRELIEEQEARLQSDLAELGNLKVLAEAEKSKVMGLISSASNSLKDYKGQISETEKKILEKEAEIKKAEENIEYLKKKLADEIAMSKRASESTWRDISEVEYADGDRYLLANLIYCEAGGEPYEGKVAVGSVVMNRVLSSVYPDTIIGVIYQNKQFSPVASGRLALALEEGRATKACYDAADEAMSGVTNVGNCVYFRTPIDGLTGIRIGGHIFY